MDIRKQLGKRILFLDGGMGSLLQARGLKAGEMPETWNLTHAQDVIAIHKDYLNAGADIILANTFGGNALKYEQQIDEIVIKGVQNARQAAIEAGKDAYTALDIGPLGKLLKPIGTLAFEDAVSIFAQTVRAGTKAGADLIVIETMGDTYEMKAAVLAAKENSDLPIIATAAFGENGKMLTGSSPVGLVAMLEGLGVDVLGLNCGLGPKQMKPIIQSILENASIPVAISPNAGLPKSINGETVYGVGPDEFAEDMHDIVEMGAWIVGGCCGTTPNHIRRLYETCNGILPKPIQNKNHTFVTSYSKVVEIGDEPVIIGERINPTGKSKFKQALRDHNMQYIMEEAVKQESSGAHILDVNVGLPEIDEVEMMKETVTSLQSILALPLQIDTSNINAMEQALRLYNGKAMINSVNGKKESMEAIFPLVKKYGGVVVGLTLDENGIPETAEERIAVAEKIYNTARQFGIDEKDIVIDALTMTMSTNSESAKITLETVRRIKAMGGRTVLGVSNISFGLPSRGIINAAFFLMALHDGLSAGIINPNTKEMMQSYDTFRVLNGLDSQCKDFIEKYAAAESAPAASPTDERSLSDCVIKGLKEQAFQTATELLKTKKPMEIITSDLIPALNVVGDGFEKGTLFLPQLLMSAEAAKAGFEAIKSHMKAAGTTQKKKAVIVLATVKGDIHDIGKNIVKVLLENYGYDVVDLGKDVAPETIVDTVSKTYAPIVGLSALMTTTVVNMEETINKLRSKVPSCKIMVGGAVLTQEYADQIGADYYGKDAMQSVHFVESLFPG